MRWPRIVLLLGRYWPYMTPGYVFEEMTLDEVQECVAHVLRWELQGVSREHLKSLRDGMQEWLCPGQTQDLSWIKPPIGKVIRNHG